MWGLTDRFPQIPVFLSFFWGLQKIADYVPDYNQGGALWFHDLTVADPTLALPVISSALMVLSVEVRRRLLAPYSIARGLMTLF